MQDRIVIDLRICNGKSVVQGTRMPVSLIVGTSRAACPLKSWSAHTASRGTTSGRAQVCGRARKAIFCWMPICRVRSPHSCAPQPGFREGSGALQQELIHRALLAQNSSGEQLFRTHFIRATIALSREVLNDRNGWKADTKGGPARIAVLRIERGLDQPPPLTLSRWQIGDFATSACISPRCPSRSKATK